MRCLNRVSLLGHVGKEPLVKATSSGAVVASFSVATSFKTKEGKELTEWHQLVAFARTAEIVRDYVVKGARVYIEGQLQTRSWDQDGQTRYRTEIVARDISLLDSKAADRSKSGAVAGAASPVSASANPKISDDDIPF